MRRWEGCPIKIGQSNHSTLFKRFRPHSGLIAKSICRIGQASILGGRSGRKDSCKPADLANDSEHFYDQSVVTKTDETGAGNWSRLDYNLKSVCLILIEKTPRVINRRLWVGL